MSKGSFSVKMPGDEGQQFSQPSAAAGLYCAQPGKKLLFMGGEFGQWSEWNHQRRASTGTC